MGGMFGMGGGGAAGAQPSAEEMAKMQEELAALDPKALEQLPPELREAVLQGGAAGPAAGNPAGAGAPSLPAGLPGGLPGLGAGMPGMPGMPGLGGLGGGFPGMGGGRNLARMPSQKAGKRKKKKR